MTSPPLSEPVFFILLSLSRVPRHGYAILQEVEEWTEGRVQLRTATLYTALRRLTEEGLVEEVEDPGDESGDGRRRYYALAPSGHEALRRETGRLRELVALAERRRAEPEGV